MKPSAMAICAAVSLLPGLPHLHEHVPGEVVGIVVVPHHLAHGLVEGQISEEAAGGVLKLEENFVGFQTAKRYAGAARAAIKRPGRPNV